MIQKFSKKSIKVILYVSPFVKGLYGINIIKDISPKNK